MKPITEDMTVNTAVHHYPSSLPLFAAAGLDTCCAGGLPIGIAAEKHGVDVAGLLADLNAAINDEEISNRRMCML